MVSIRPDSRNDHHKRRILHLCRINGLCKLFQRFCTIVSSDLIRKIRIIANRERLQIKDVVNAAFEKAIKSYERKHGTIDDDVKRDAKDLF